MVLDRLERHRLGGDQNVPGLGQTRAPRNLTDGTPRDEIFPPIVHAADVEPAKRSCRDGDFETKSRRGGGIGGGVRLGSERAGAGLHREAALNRPEGSVAERGGGVRVRMRVSVFAAHGPRGEERVAGEFEDVTAVFADDGNDGGKALVDGVSHRLASQARHLQRRARTTVVARAFTRFESVFAVVEMFGVGVVVVRFREAKPSASGRESLHRRAAHLSTRHPAVGRPGEADVAHDVAEQERGGEGLVVRARGRGGICDEALEHEVRDERRARAHPAGGRGVEGSARGSLRDVPDLGRGGVGPDAEWGARRGTHREDTRPSRAHSSPPRVESFANARGIVDERAGRDAARGRIWRGARE